jgi:hypothetical protein
VCTAAAEKKHWPEGTSKMTITESQKSREARRAVLLSLLVLGALGLVACGGGDDDEDSGTGARSSPEEKIERVGNEWAPLFAGGERFCALMTQPACERITCKRIAGPIENCTPPSSEYRKSFEDATVEDIGIKGGKAGARFSNGETVKLEKVNVPDPLAEDGERFGWLIHKIGRNAGDVELITEVGNAWARLFAEDNSAACEFMFGQPLCAEFFGRVGEPPEVGRPSGFQESFANATVERVELKDAKQIRAEDGTPIELHRAVAEFSNGEVVKFIEETDAPRSDLGKWFVDDLVRSAGS